jgi:hypothetical protein
MNIFQTCQSPVVAANWLCKEHLHKMPVESAQLLSTGLHELSNDSYEFLINEVGIYKPVHVGHPSRLWISESPNNFAWLINHATRMFGIRKSIGRKEHKSEAIIQRIFQYFSENMMELRFKESGVTPILFAFGDGTKPDKFLDIKQQFGNIIRPATKTTQDLYRANSFDEGYLAYQEYIRRKQFEPTTKYGREHHILRRPTWVNDTPPKWYYPV